jgi:hypothetical protein
MIISEFSNFQFMQKHILIELNKIIEERMGSLTEEVEIATNARMNPLYLIDRKDELESLRWVTRIITWVLDRAIDGRQLLGVTHERLELEDTKKFENMIHDKIQELEVELVDSDSTREKEVIRNEIETLNCVLGHLINLKPIGNKRQAVDITTITSKHIVQ